LIGPQFVRRLLMSSQKLIERNSDVAEVMSLLKEYLHDVAEGKESDQRLNALGKAMRERMDAGAKKAIGQALYDFLQTMTEQEKANLQQAFRYDLHFVSLISVFLV